MTTPTTKAGRALLEAPHIVEFSRTGYGLQHPIQCRPNLIGCSLNRWLARQNGPAQKPGRYLMTAPGEFKPMPEGWADPISVAAILVIEAEAVATERARLAEAVRDPEQFGWRGLPEYAIAYAAAIRAVLRLIEEKE